MLKKSFTLLFGLCVLGCLLVGCSSQAQPPTDVFTSTATATPQGSFTVTKIDMQVTPDKVTAKCGTQATFTYTATFHVANNTSGGTIKFSYTVNNGRGSTETSITLAAGETQKNYSFTWSGTLTDDHVYPGQGGVYTTSPNEVHSPMVKPSGVCS